MEGFDWDGIYSCSVDLEQNVIVCGDTYSDSIFGYHGLQDTLFSSPPDHDTFLASFSRMEEETGYVFWRSWEMVAGHVYRSIR